MASLFQPGDGLGGHHIVRLLGAGGFAEVYEAVDAAGTRRALKVLAPEGMRGSSVRAGLAREAQALLRIEHPNVVQLFEAGIEEDRVYLVLEMVEGRTLGEKLGDPLTVAALEDVVEWVYQACEGVAEAHEVGVIHRDLKPANILVTPSGVVKVIDFGVAALRSWTTSSASNLNGTALYMAPEVLHGQPSHAGVDVYAMGVILYEALTGTHPLELAPEEATVFAVFQQHLLLAEPRPIRDLAPDVPVSLAALIHEALAKDPQRRLPTMRALADGLRDSLAEMLANPVVAARRASNPFPSMRPGASVPPRVRSAFPPPRPREGIRSPPPPSRPALPPAPPASVAAGPPSRPRRSSSGPMVVEAVRALVSRRRVIPAALLLALLAAGAFFGTRMRHAAAVGAGQEPPPLVDGGIRAGHDGGAP